MATRAATSRSTLTSAERAALLPLRNRYHLDSGFFSDCELQRLQFFRWLYEAGRLGEGPGGSASDSSPLHR